MFQQLRVHKRCVIESETILACISYSRWAVCLYSLVDYYNITLPILPRLFGLVQEFGQFYKESM